MEPKQQAPRGDAVYRFTVTYERGEDGCVIASVPALPGCHSQGRTVEEARRNIREAARGYVASLEHRGEQVPEETDTEQIEVAAHGAAPRSF